MLMWVSKTSWCEKAYIWNPAACSYENSKYLASVKYDSAIICDKIIEE